METFVEQGFEGFEAKAPLCRARVVAARGRGAKPRRAPRCHTDSDILARYPSQDLVHPFARRKSARGIAAPLTTDRNVSPVLETSTARRRWENERSIPFLLLLLVPPSSYS